MAAAPAVIGKTSTYVHHQPIQSNNINNKNEGIFQHPKYVEFVSVQGVWHRIPAYKNHQSQSLPHGNGMVLNGDSGYHSRGYEYSMHVLNEATILKDDSRVNRTPLHDLKDVDLSFLTADDKILEELNPFGAPCSSGGMKRSFVFPLSTLPTPLQNMYQSNTQTDAFLLPCATKKLRTPRTTRTGSTSGFTKSQPNVLDNLIHESLNFAGAPYSGEVMKPSSLPNLQSYQNMNPSNNQNGEFLAPGISKKSRTSLKRTKDDAIFSKLKRNVRRPPILIPRQRQLPLTRVNEDVVGICGQLNVNPYFRECIGLVSVIKGEQGLKYFCCGNCGTRRRFLEESGGPLIQKK